MSTDPDDTTSHQIDRDKLLSDQAKTLITTSMATLAVLFHFFNRDLEIGTCLRWVLAGAFLSFAVCVVSALFGQGYLTEEDYPQKSLPNKVCYAFFTAYLLFGIGILLATSFFIASLWGSS